MAVDVDLPARICTNELVVATAAATGVAVATGVGVAVGAGVADGLGVAETVGEGFAVVCVSGRRAVSLAKLPRCPNAIVASVRPPASKARTSTPPKVATTLSIGLLRIVFDIQPHNRCGHRCDYGQSNHKLQHHLPAAALGL